jgi:uncharacterized protein (TIGR02217 family)
MPITIYNDVIMPNSVLSAGVRGKQIRNNTRTEAQNGGINVNINWSKTLRQYELGTVPMLLTAWQAIEGLHEVTDGGAYGFLMEDPKDHNVATGEGLLYPYTTDLIGTNGLGYGLPTYKLHKRYTSVGSSRSKDRAITRPHSPIVLKRDASTVTIGSSAGNAAVNYDTGTVTFVADISEAVSSVTVGASTVLNFADGLGIVAAMSVGQRVYLTGIAGTAATILNSLSHAISAKGAASLTISTVTTGLTATGGTANKYPQASEALTWTGKFYVPVHFESDTIDWELLIAGYADARYLAGPSVVLNEVRE